MLDIGWQELFIVALIALVVIGPKDLPGTLRAIARMLSKARALSREFQNGFSEMVREAELDELKRKVESTAQGGLKQAVKDTVDPSGSLTADFDPAAFARKLKEDVEGEPPLRSRAAAPSEGADLPPSSLPDPPDAGARATESGAHAAAEASAREPPTTPGRP